MTEAPQATVVIVNYNRADLLPASWPPSSGRAVVRAEPERWLVAQR